MSGDRHVSAALECPHGQDLETLPIDDLPADQEERLEQHLNSCAVCRERLDRAARDEVGLLHLARQFGDPARAADEPHLARVRGFLHELKVQERAAPAEPADLYFLEPADRPELLGMLGEYEVQEVIGQGGMGVVLKAFDPALHRLVAIKVLAAAVAGSATARRRFAREAQAAAAVCHEHIVAVHGVHETYGLPYLVMQYIAGESLQSRLDRDGPLDVIEAVRIAMQTASGLAAAHAQGLIHRDIKPANLLLEDSLARVRISDFGLARMVDDVGLTQAGVVAGTPEYMAPEQARGEPIDHRADLFSLGSVLYALCTGRPPFQGTPAVAVLRMVNDESPPPVRSLNPDVPEWLEAIIARLMAKDPSHRLQSAAEVAALLERYLAHLRQPVLPAPELPSGPSSPGQIPPQGAVMREKARGFWLPALALLAVLGLGTALRIAGGAGRLGKSEPGAEYHEYQVPLHGPPVNLPRMKLIGPDADQCAQFEPAGLHITSPAGYPRPRQVGLSTGVALKGDFEITVTFEILNESAPQHAGSAGDATSLNLWLYRTGGDRCIASIGRRIAVNAGTQFAALSTRYEPEVGKVIPTGETIPTEARTGRLRLVRRGEDLSYYVSEGSSADFALLTTFTIGKDDLNDLRLIGTTLDPQASLDARFSDLHICMGSRPGAGNDSGSAMASTWLAMAVIIGVLLALSVSLGTWLYVRRRRGASGQPEGEGVVPLLSFRCSSCGTKLRVKLDLADRKAKCPQCGQMIHIPPADPDAGGSQRGLAPRSRKAVTAWPRRHPLVTVLMLVGLLGLVVAPLFRPRTVEEPPPAGEIHQDFRGQRPRFPFELIGPNAGEVVRSENEGLRVTLPGNRPQGQRDVVGLVAHLPLSGDFSITGTFEMLSSEPPPRGFGMGVAVQIASDSNFTKFVKLGRFLNPDLGSIFVVESWDKESLRHPHDRVYHHVPTQARSGELRLVREGSSLRCLVAEAPGEDFHEIYRQEFGTHDVEIVRFVVNNHNCPVSVDARLIDLKVHADRLPAILVPPSQARPERRWLATAGLIGLVLLATAASLIALRIRHHRSSPEEKLRQEEPAITA
jgi:serine/threonine protein kinase/DNA-directed RNA polymerase subunit RPC12/RpoP